MLRSYLYAGLAIIAGGMIYLFFRPEIIAFKDILPYTKHMWLNVRNTNYFVYFFLYCLPDALWYWALIHLQLAYIQRYRLHNKWIAIVSVLLPFALEIMQYIGLCRGTFDWCDIFTYLTVLIFTIWKQKQKLGFLLPKSQFS